MWHTLFGFIKAPREKWKMEKNPGGFVFCEQIGRSVYSLLVFSCSAFTSQPQLQEEQEVQEVQEEPQEQEEPFFLLRCIYTSIRETTAASIKQTIIVGVFIA